MDIFIWKAYGEIEVCAADTQKQLTVLFNEICGALELWGMDNTIIEIHTQIEKNNYSILSLKSGINRLLREIGVGTHEAFEKGTKFDTVRNL